MIRTEKSLTCVKKIVQYDFISKRFQMILQNFKNETLHQRQSANIRRTKRKTKESIWIKERYYHLKFADLKGEDFIAVTKSQ